MNVLRTQKLALNRLSFYRLAVVALTLPISISCSKIGFGTEEGSALAIQSLCGLLDGQPTDGPQITSPLNDAPVQQLITLQGTCEGTANVEITGGALVLPLNTSCLNGRFEQIIRMKDGEGMKDIAVKQSGYNGTGRRCVMMDTRPPLVAIIPPTSIVGNNNLLNVGGTCENGLPVDLSQDGQTGSQTAACINGRFQAQYPSSAGDGGKLIVATQRDPAGNQGRDDQGYTIDTVAPIVRFTSPTSGTLVRNSVAVAGTCETGLPVLLNGTGPSPATTTPCSNGTFSATLNLASQDGILSLVAEQTDLAGNRGWDLRNVNRDTTAPVIAFRTPAAGTTAQIGLAITGVCTDGLPIALTGTGITNPQTLTCNTGAFAANITFSAGDGAKPVSVSQTDVAGNVGSDTRSFNRDNTPPTITITGPAVDFVTRSTLALTGTCTNGLSITMSGAATGTLTCVNGLFSSTVTLSAPDGSKNISVSQTDAAGNTGSANRNFILDTAAPAITITGPAVNTSAITGVTLVGTCTSGLPVALSGSGLQSPSSTTCSAGAFSAPILFSVGEGTKNIVASQTDAAGNVGSDNRNFLRDNTAPIITIAAPAANTTTASGLTISGVCTNGLPIQVSGAVNAPSTATCTNGSYSAAIILSAGDGTKNVVVAQTDEAGNRGTDNRNFILDTAAPAISITGPAADFVTRSTIALTGTCTNGLPITMTGAATGTLTCANGLFSSTVTLTTPDGPKNIVVSQTSIAGITGSDNRNFILDTTAPTITITAPQANTVAQTGVTLVGTCTNGLPIALSGSGLQAPNTTTCTAGGFSVPILFNAGEGTKNIVASQTDAAGNVGSDNRNFVRDNTGPAITITAPSVDFVTRNTISLVGNCTDGLPIAMTGNLTGTLTCLSGQFSSVVNLTGPDGVKNIAVSQTDAAGNVGSDNRNFVLDTTAPTITITGPAVNTIAQTGVTLVGTCTNGLPIALSGAGLQSPSSATCSAGSFSVAISFNAGEGTKNIVASQTDAAGNVGSDNRNFIRDNTGPEIVITAPIAGTTAQTGLTISGTCTAGLTVNLSGAGLLANAMTSCSSGTFSAAILFSAGEGSKNVIASQTDSAGNVGSDSRDFIRDNTGPAIAITAPAANTVAQTGLTVSGTCTAGLTVTLNGTGISLPVTTSCASGTFSSAITFSGTDGIKNVVASQTDAAGNVGSDNRDFLKDTTAPSITIASPAANTVTSGSLQLSGTCATGLPVNLSGGILAPSMAVCLNAQWTANVTLISPDGIKNIVASQTDTVGNVGSDNRNFVLDTDAPVIRIAAPAANSITRTGITLSGTCTAGLTVNISGSVNAPSTTTCASGSFSANISFSGGDGTKNIVASQTDAAGNSGSDNRDFILDTTAPVVRIVSPASGSVAQTGVTLTGNCETGLAVNLSGAGIATPGPVSCVGGNFSANVTFSNGDGTKNIIAAQTDAAGNTGSDNRDFVKDTTAPTITIVTPLSNAVTQGALTLTGTCVSGLTVNVSGGITSSTTTTCSASSFSVGVTLAGADGVKNVAVSQTDAAGNTGSDNRNFVKDTTGPLITIVSPSNGSTITSAFTLVGTCEAGLALNITGSIVGTSTTTCPVSGNFSIPLTASTGSGSKTVVASQTDLVGNAGSATATYTVNPTPSATEVFTADASEGKVDILFVDDNSASMDPEQAELGSKFPSFIAQMMGLDWQVGITTTDCSTGRWGICGSLLNMVGTASNILTAAVPGFDTVFRNTIVRPETIDCVARGECPGGLEEGLKASINAFNKRNTVNAGMFRDDAALAVVVITDEDEQSTGPAAATKPQAVIDSVNAAWGADKKFKGYAITILTGDAQCLRTQQDQQAGIGAYGTHPMELARLTGGQSVSICAPDYSVTLQQIGQDLRKLTSAVKLSRVPTASSVRVTFTPVQNVTWTVSGDSVLFNTPVAAGTRIEVYYEY